MVLNICKDILNSELEESLALLRNLMEESTGNVDSVLEARQLLIVTRMRQKYADHSWVESYPRAVKDVDQILNPFVLNSARKNLLRKSQMNISETLFDITEDLENTKFCVVCHKEHGKLTWSYLLEELASENPDIVNKLIQMHSGKEKENGGTDMMDTKQSSLTNSTDGSQSTQCSE